MSQQPNITELYTALIIVGFFVFVYSEQHVQYLPVLKRSNNSFCTACYNDLDSIKV